MIGTRQPSIGDSPARSSHSFSAIHPLPDGSLLVSSRHSLVKTGSAGGAPAGSAAALSLIRDSSASGGEAGPPGMLQGPCPVRPASAAGAEGGEPECPGAISSSFPAPPTFPTGSAALW